MTETGRLRANGDGHPARRDRLAAVGEHRPLRARPPISGGLAGDEPLPTADANSCNGQVARPTGSSGTPMTFSSSSREPEPRQKALLEQFAGRVAGTRPEAQGREDCGHPHRRRLRVPRPADRPPTPAPEALRLYLRLQRGVGLDQTQGQGPDRALHDQHGAVRADRSAQPGPAGLGESLPARRGQTHASSTSPITPGGESCAGFARSTRG